MTTAPGLSARTVIQLPITRQQAARLGLAEAGRHAWRAQVPTAELADVIEQTRAIGVQPRFGSQPMI